MRTRPLGPSALDVSVICLGTMTFGWTTDEAQSFAVMNEALDRGVNFFDTANMYSRWSTDSHAGKTEEIMGRWFAQDPSRRARVILASKVRGQMSDRADDQGLSARHIREQIDASLRRLQTDHLDLYQSHWWDADAPVDETLRAFEDIVRSGKARAIGCSNFDAAQLQTSLDASKRLGVASYASLQPHYNLLQRSAFERATRAVITTNGLGVIPYSPLAGGFLTGKYSRGAAPPAGTRGEQSQRIKTYLADERAFDVIDAAAAIAKSRGATTAQIALSWVIDAPAITSAIVGANTVAQLREVLPAAELSLSTEERRRLDEASAWSA